MRVPVTHAWLCSSGQAAGGFALNVTVRTFNQNNLYGGDGSGHDPAGVILDL